MAFKITSEEKRLILRKRVFSATPRLTDDEIKYGKSLLKQIKIMPHGVYLIPSEKAIVSQRLSSGFMTGGGITWDTKKKDIKILEKALAENKNLWLVGKFSRVPLLINKEPQKIMKTRYEEGLYKGKLGTPVITTPKKGVIILALGYKDQGFTI